jgi:hypothetical protein
MVAGFTGHQDIGTAATAAWVRRQIEAVVRNHRVELGITSLAIGADQLFAAVLAEQKIAYVVIVPCKRYEETFDRAGLAKYRHFLRLATEKRTLHFEEPSERAYFEAGRQIVDQANLIIAVWDGKPAKGLGGTGDIVRYAQGESRMIVHVNPELRKVQLL